MLKASLTCALFGYVLFLLIPTGASAATCPSANAVVNENSCMGAGTSAWQVQNYSEDIAGYSSQTSFALGSSVPLKIATDLGSGRKVNIQTFRMGWYGGAGGRSVDSQSNVSVGNSFSCNPMDPTTGELSCANWSVSATVPASAFPMSGVYESLITDTTDGGIQNYVVFVVRNDSAGSKVLYVLPSATYEAYNTWGGKSLYFDKNGGSNTVSGSDRAVAVSFDRPLDNGMSSTNRFFGPDQEMVQWLEEQGYDVSYTDDIQTDQNGVALKNHQVDVISGHSEYWSAATFNNFLAARDAGVNIASFSGNTAYWQTRYTNDTGRWCATRPSRGRARRMIRRRWVRTGSRARRMISRSWRPRRGVIRVRRRGRRECRRVGGLGLVSLRTSCWGTCTSAITMAPSSI